MVLQTMELLDAAEVGKLRPRWEGPLPVAAVAGPNTYPLTPPCAVQVQSHRQRRPAQALLPLELLNSKTVRGRTYYLVLWQGHASAADSWEPAEHLANCQERVAKYEAAPP